MSWRDEPKRWYSVSECGCATTSTHHPWVLNGLSLSGEYVNTCDQHKPKPRNNPMTDITLEQRARELLDAESAFVWPARQYNAALRAIEEALRLSAEADADAARYRFLRRNWQLDITTDVWMWCDVDGIDDTVKLDATIDERIAAAPRHEPGEVES